MEPKDIKSLPMPAVVLELGASRGLTGVYLGHLMAQKCNKSAERRRQMVGDGRWRDGRA